LKGKFKGKISVLIILLVSIGLGFFTYVIIKDQQSINEDVLKYLEQEGVDIEEDIEDLEILNIGEDDRKLAVVVIYKEEPETAYVYTHDDHGDIYEYDQMPNTGE